MYKVYLGDSVYVEIENDMIKLTTDNGYGVTNTIYLDYDVYKCLVNFVNKKDREKYIFNN